MLLLARKERLDRASPVLLASQALPFFVPFASQKMDYRVRVSPLQFHLLKKKKHKDNSLCFFWRGRRDSTGQALSCLLRKLSHFLSLLLRKRWTIEFESLLFILLFTKKRYQGKILDTFSGAEGETRQGKPCLVCFANSPIFCPFCFAKDGLLSSSLSYLFCYSQRKGIKEKSLIPFLARKERLELSRRFPDLRP